MNSVVADVLPPLSSVATENVESPKILRSSGETSSFHLLGNTEINSETFLQQPKTDLESSMPTLLPGAIKQFSLASDSVVVESSTFNTLSSAPSALFDEYALVMTNNEGRRRETLNDQSRVANWNGSVVNGCHTKLN